MKKGLFAFTALAFTVVLSYGAERYKDRMFDVKVENGTLKVTQEERKNWFADFNFFSFKVCIKEIPMSF